MQYLLISKDNDPALSFLKELYHSAFPEEERRDWGFLLKMIGKVPEMRLELIKDGEKEVGFVTSWHLMDWCFIEHLAIDPHHRGKKYGERVMKDFMAKGRLLLEVEPPESADARRRISFYERLGMHVLKIAYEQPSYRNLHESYPMLLMSNVPEVHDEQFNVLINKVQQQVYTML